MGQGSGRRVLGIDAIGVVAVLAIVAASVYVLSTAIVAPDGSNPGFGLRQGIFALVGLVPCVVISQLPTATWERFWPHAWVLAIAGIVVVMVLGTTVNGAKRWIDLGPVSFQPSETGKVLVMVAIAGFLATRLREVQRGRTFIAALALAGVPALLVFAQPDFGTAQVYGFLVLGLLLFAGARWTHMAMLGGIVVGLAVLVLGVLPALGIEVLHDYQKQRLVGFIDPEADPSGTNYQTIQAKIAIGSGQLTGRGAEESTQVRDAFLPEPQTDFVFATLTERYGFVGGATLLALYMVLISRVLRAVALAPNAFGRLLAGGVATLLFSQVAINVGMVVGVLPVTGVPLPLFSYGGSAMLANLVALGFVGAVLREAESPHVRYARRRGAGAAERLRRAAESVGPTGGHGSRRRGSSLAGSGQRRRTRRLTGNR